MPAIVLGAWQEIDGSALPLPPRGGCGAEKVHSCESSQEETRELRDRESAFLPTKMARCARTTRDEVASAVARMIAMAFLRDGARRRAVDARQLSAGATALGTLAMLMELEGRLAEDSREDGPRSFVDAESSTETTGIVPSGGRLVRQRSEAIEVLGGQLDEMGELRLRFDPEPGGAHGERVKATGVLEDDLLGVGEPAKEAARRGAKSARIPRFEERQSATEPRVDADGLADERLGDGMTRFGVGGREGESRASRHERHSALLLRAAVEDPLSRGARLGFSIGMPREDFERGARSDVGAHRLRAPGVERLGHLDAVRARLPATKAPRAGPERGGVRGIEGEVPLRHVVESRHLRPGRGRLPALYGRNGAGVLAQLRAERAGGGFTSIWFDERQARTWHGREGRRKAGRRHVPLSRSTGRTERGKREPVAMSKLARERRRLELVDAKALSPEVRWLAFRRVEGPPLEYLPGQYVNLFGNGLPDGAFRSYSMCAAPSAHDPDRIELAVTHVATGAMSRALHAMPIGTIVEADGPWGLFTLERAPREAPKLFVATGTGVTPIRAMLEAELTRDGARATLLFGCRSRADVLFRDEFLRWAEQHPGFRYEVTFSQDESFSFGRCGYVQSHLRDVLASLPGAHVFVCGLRAMIDEVRCALKDDLAIDRRCIHTERYD